MQSGSDCCEAFKSVANITEKKSHSIFSNFNITLILGLSFFFDTTHLLCYDWLQEFSLMIALMLYYVWNFEPSTTVFA